MQIAVRTIALRWAAVALVALLVVSVLAGSSRAAPRGSSTVDQGLSAAVVAQVNAVRTQAGLRSLSVSKSLSRAAQEHAISMATLGYFSHSSANGSGPVRRITAYYHVRGATSWAVGEVLVWARGALTAGQALELWLASPSHRTQVLSRRWREIGVTAVRAVGAPGVYGGRNVTIIVVDFGTRS